MPRDAALLLLFVGGLTTFATSLLLFMESMRGRNKPGGGAPGFRAGEMPAEGEAAPRRRSSFAGTFIFIGFLPVPLLFGGFWKSGARNRLLRTIYLTGLFTALAGAVLWFLG